MAKRQYIPAAIKYADKLASSIERLEGMSMVHTAQPGFLTQISGILSDAAEKLNKLESEVKAAQEIKDPVEMADVYKDNVFNAMGELREKIDGLEKLIPPDYWPGPTYVDMMFKI